ncbi:MAG: hypothetical protein JWN04_4215 [Myxococcaceae bacterium]|nr:hypothetical protein [Myxococcaceae bacterium]
MYQAIETRFFGPTNHRGSRVRVKCQARTMYVSWDHALDSEANHVAAARALATAMEWSGAWVGGALADGRGYAFASLRGSEEADFHVA